MPGYDHDTYLLIFAPSSSSVRCPFGLDSRLCPGLGPVHTTPFLLVSVFVASKLPFTLLRFRTKTVRKTSVFVRSH